MTINMITWVIGFLMGICFISFNLDNLIPKMILLATVMITARLNDLEIAIKRER